MFSCRKGPGQLGVVLAVAGPAQNFSSSGDSTGNSAGRSQASGTQGRVSDGTTRLMIVKLSVGLSQFFFVRCDGWQEDGGLSSAGSGSYIALDLDPASVRFNELPGDEEANPRAN